MHKDYSPEEKADIEARVEKAQAYLKELELVLEAQVFKVNLGSIDPKYGNTFGDFVQPFLKDTKYSKKTDAPAS